MYTKIVELRKIHKPKTCGSKTAIAYMDNRTIQVNALICVGCGKDLR